MEDHMIVLRLDNVTFSYPGGLALEKLTWAIEERAKVGLVGPNGTGKSRLDKRYRDFFSQEDDGKNDC
jgi:ABC-type molybdenum transport system ATPase subunit/photorepair protein PhrA